MNLFMLQMFDKFGGETKIGGWVRAGIAYEFGIWAAHTVGTKWAWVGDILSDATFENLVGGACAMVVVGGWSHFVKTDKYATMTGTGDGNAPSATTG